VGVAKLVPYEASADACDKGEAAQVAASRRRRTERARRDPRCPRRLIDFQHPMEVSKVDLDRDAVAVAGDVGASPKWDRRARGVTAPVEAREQPQPRPAEATRSGACM
jgi:hypothetical protein